MVNPSAESESTTEEESLSRAEALAKAEVLIEALPWLKRYNGAIVVVKFGGNAMVSESLKRAFADDMVFLRHAGLNPIVVHGGGPQISGRLKELGIASEFRGGYRVTTPETIAVVRSVLRDEVNRELVDLINEHGDFAVGLSGDDGELFEATRRGAIVDGETIDLGLVGDITHVDPSRVLALVNDGRIPVVTSLAPEVSDRSNILNVNADAAAAALAVAVSAQKLLVLTDVAGLYSDWPNRESLVSVITSANLRELLPSLESGMIPKMTACLDAVDGGVLNAAIIDGRVDHSVLLEVFTTQGLGTQVVESLSDALGEQI